MQSPSQQASLLQTPIGRLRVIACLEGCSYLLLLGIAMPLKYWAGFPVAVRLAGALHGVLFIGFCAALAQSMWVARWSVARAALVFLASLVPFGTFFIDASLRREDRALRNDGARPNGAARA